MCALRFVSCGFLLFAERCGDSCDGAEEHVDGGERSLGGKKESLDCIGDNEGSKTARLQVCARWMSMLMRERDEARDVAEKGGTS